MKSFLGYFLIFLNLFLLLCIFLIPVVFSDEGNNNISIVHMVINNYSEEITLNSDDSKSLQWEVLIEHRLGENYIESVKGYFYDTSESEIFDGDDNNYHYSDLSCELNTNFGNWRGYSDDSDRVLAICSFDLEYYSNPGEWGCYVLAEDNSSQNSSKQENITILELLAVKVSDFLDYGNLNGLAVSEEKEISIENIGNVKINMELTSYGLFEGDGVAMSCTNGSIGNISLEYQRYNIGSSNPSNMSLSEFQDFYEAFEAFEDFKVLDLDYRKNDVSSEAIENLYTRIYVPEGVAGSCIGNIKFNFLQSG